MLPDAVRLETDTPVPCPWVKKRFWKLEEAVVEVAVTVPTKRLPIVEVEKLPKVEWKFEEVA